MIVTRFAPSPTGEPHIGNIRTALFAWMFAKKNGGEFFVRIEDTDKSREIPGAVQAIVESLEWLGLNYDKNLIFQSERLKIYKLCRQTCEKRVGLYLYMFRRKIGTITRRADQKKRAADVRR